ncbi:MAG: HlyD family efflux transporter periplasmic adaptor subunit [Rhodobacteraceae bacterium]|nr:HlyD family efflux transporter periplasmic adaptor subunit [Paracoccaceae bacterium]
MRFLSRSLLALFLLGGTLGILAVAFDSVYSAFQERASRETRNRPQRERIYAVKVIPAEITSVKPQISTFGETRSRRTLELRAPIGGIILELSPSFVEGGVLEKGDFVLRIDASEAEATFQFALADRNDAESEVKEAIRSHLLVQDELVAAEEREALLKRSLDRQVELLERGVGTSVAAETAELSLSSAKQSVLSIRKNVAQAELRVDQAKSRLARREIALVEAQRKLDATSLEAEFSGVLSGISIVQGGRLSANERIGTLIDPTALEVAFRVSNTQYRRLLDANGNLLSVDVVVQLELSDTSISTNGRIVREGAAASEGQIGRLLFASIGNSREVGLKPGDFVSVSIEEPELGGIMRLPATAIDSSGRILVLDDDNRLEDADVELLRRLGDEIVVRGRGLRDRMIVAERTPLLGVGIKVKPILPEQDGITAQDKPEMIALSAEERDKLIAMVESNSFMPARAKARVIEQLKKPEVPAAVLDRLGSRAGG